MSKGTHFFGQPVYGQLIKCLNKDKVLEMSRKHGGERYIKSFDGWHHLLTMLYAVILRFDSPREIGTSMLAEVRKLGYLGLKTIPRRSTLSDANSRRPEKFFVQADKAELSTQILLWRERQRHQDSDQGHTDSQSAYDTAPAKH